MQWNIRDVEPETKARIKSFAALTNLSIADALTKLMDNTEYMVNLPQPIITSNLHDAKQRSKVQESEV